MKKSILIAGFLFIGSLAFSQNEKQPILKPAAFSIGPSAGIGHSFMYPYITRGINPFGNFGIISIYAPSEHWGVGLDARYSMEGSRTRSLEGPRETDLDYVRVLLKGIYFFGKYEDAYRPKLTLGPCIGFLTRQTDTFGAKANPIDFGLTATAGFNYKLSNHGMSFNVDAYYYQGLTDVMQHTGIREMNANIGLDIGLAFGL